MGVNLNPDSIGFQESLNSEIYVDKTGMIELKKDGSAKAVVEQIRSKSYSDKPEGYSGEVILVGINYDSKEKKHSCVIEKSNYRISQ